jgi:glycosyltransferase involved in cell wall biosynthesis
MEFLSKRVAGQVDRGALGPRPIGNRPPLLVDARWFGPHGIGRFASAVLTRLPDHVRLTGGPRPLSLLDPIWLSYQLAARRPSVFFSPGFNPPAVCRVPLVITIHDLAHIQLPCFSTYRRRFYYEYLVRPASNRARRVITVSEYSRREILRWTGLPESSVTNVGNGVDSTFRPEGHRYDPGFPYILYVGNGRPHKNLDRLFSAFAAIDDPYLHLVLTTPKTHELTAQLIEKRIEKRVHCPGPVTDEELPALYRGALALVFPSLMEGFGLPPLEAMASGTPVVASRSTAIPEVVGEAALLVDPLDAADIRQGIERVLEDRALRGAMRQAGLARARLFSWDTVAAKVNQVIQEIA